MEIFSKQNRKLYVKIISSGATIKINFVFYKKLKESLFLILNNHF
jgi:hypothetical protein